MVRKWAGRAILLYILYAAAMYWYIFYGVDTSIPEALRGTAADPATFLNARELKLSEEYSGLRNFIFSYPRHMNGCCISSFYYLVFQKHLKSRQWQSRNGKRSERASTYSGFPLFLTWPCFRSVSLDIG